MKYWSILLRLIRKLSNRTLSIFLIITCIALGWAGNDIFSRYKLTYFDLEKDINIVDVLTLLATIFLAYYIPAVLGNKEQNTRIEKDFILNKVHECSGMIEVLMQTTRKNSADYRETAASLQNIVLAVSRIGRYALSSGIDIEAKNKEIKKQLRQLRNLMTDTLTTAQINDFNQNGIELPIKVNNNLITFSKVRIREIMQEDLILERHLFDLIILINRNKQ